MMVHLLATTALAMLGTQVQAVTISTGRGFSYIINPATREALAFGKNDNGQLGIGYSSLAELAHTPVDTQLMVNSEIVHAAAGAFHGLFVNQVGVAYAAGRNNHGQLCLDELLSVNPVPTPVIGLLQLEIRNISVVSVAAGYAHSLFLLSDGSVRSCGYNNAGQLGDGTFESRKGPVKVVFPETGLKIKAVAAGYDFSYFLTDSGQLWATGNGLGGQLGDGMRDVSAMPVFVTEDVDSVSAGEAHGLFVKTGALMGVGANFDGQLGSAGLYAEAPIEIVAESVEGAFAGGDSSSFLVSESMSLYGLGSNRKGQLGLGNETLLTPAPMQIEVRGFQGTIFEAAAIGSSHSLFLTQGPVVYSAGDNSYGELGDGTTDPSDGWLDESPYGATPTPTTTSTQTATMTATTVTETATVSATETQTVTETLGATTTGTRGAQGVFPPLSMTTYIAIGVVAGVAGLALVCYFVCSCRNRQTQQVDQDLPNDEAGLELARAEMSM